MFFHKDRIMAVAPKRICSAFLTNRVRFYPVPFVRAGLTAKYKRMFEDDRDTGKVKKDILTKVGKSREQRGDPTQARRFQPLCKRLVAFPWVSSCRDKICRRRTLFQIGDTTDGRIVWEGLQELNCAVDSMTEKKVPLKTVPIVTAQNLIAQLPKE